jgi:hypothetical protein
MHTQIVMDRSGDTRHGAVSLGNYCATLTLPPKRPFSFPSYRVDR